LRVRKVPQLALGVSAAEKRILDPRIDLEDLVVIADRFLVVLLLIRDGAQQIERDDVPRVQLEHLQADWLGAVVLLYLRQRETLDEECIPRLRLGRQRLRGTVEVGGSRRE